LDLSVNKSIKDFLKNKFQSWYADGIVYQLKDIDGDCISTMQPVDLRMSVSKPLGAKWLIEAFKYIKSHPSIITNGYNKAGITHACLDLN
jgi:hypothetical protein